MSKLRESDLKKLTGVHPDLIKVVERAKEFSEFAVLEGLRTVERQRELVAKGASQTMASRHITGHAVDIAPLVAGQVSWDWRYYYPMANAMKKAAAELGVQIVWGGAWKNLNDLPNPITSKDQSKTFADGPHFELDRAIYK